MRNTDNAPGANDTGLPGGTIERLALFSEWTGTTPPETLTAGEAQERTFSDDLLAYAEDTGLSLDWLWLGDERALVMRSFHAAQEARA